MPLCNRLAVFGRHSLDELEAMVVTRFSAVPNKQVSHEGSCTPNAHSAPLLERGFRPLGRDFSSIHPSMFRHSLLIPSLVLVHARE